MRSCGRGKPSTRGQPPTARPPRDTDAPSLGTIAMNLAADRVIAERRLTFKDQSSNPKDVRVVLGGPTHSTDKEEYSCDVQIVGLGDAKVRRIFGVIQCKPCSWHLSSFQKCSTVIEAV